MGTEREFSSTQATPTDSIDDEVQGRRPAPYANWSIVFGALSLLPCGVLLLLVLIDLADLPLPPFLRQALPGIVSLLYPISWALAFPAVLLGATGKHRSNTYNRSLALIGIWMGMAVIIASTATMLVFS